MSIQKPSVRRPRIPKIKKPSISKRKRLVKKQTTLSMRKTKPKIPNTKTTKRKKPPKTVLGTCYVEKNCVGVLARKVSKTQCRVSGGKSWKKFGGKCEKL